MKTILSLVLIIAFAFTPIVAQSSLNQKTIDSLMALSFDEFDQNMAGGWRYYADKGDLETASELIKLYLSNHPEIESSQSRVMNFHCGQMLAMMNKNMEAIPYMEASKNTEKDIMQWNIYVDATISFLRKDRDVFDEKIKEFEDKSIMPKEQNRNLNVLKLLEAGFDKTYKEALIPE